MRHGFTDAPTRCTATRRYVYRELRRIRSADEVDEGLAWTVDFLAREFSAMRGEEGPSDVEREDALVFGMSRR